MGLRRSTSVRIVALVAMCGMALGFNVIGPATPAARAADTWTATASLTTARYAHTATRLADGTVLVAGGVNSSGNPMNSWQIYNPSTAAWTNTVALMDRPRNSHAASLLADGNVLVTGGWTGSASTTTAVRFDSFNNTWQAVGSMPSPAREAHTSTTLQDGRVLVTGGFNGSTPTATAALYDPTAATFSTTGALPSARGLHTATLLNNGLVLIAGGSTSGSCASGAALNTSALFNPATGTFSTTSNNMGTARCRHTATLLSDGRVLVAGGFNGSARTATAELYNPATGQWQNATSMPVARDNHAATRLSNGKVLVASGFSASDYTTSVHIYDPTAGTWAATTALSPGRQLHTATLLTDGKVLAVGGLASTGSPTNNAQLFALDEQSTTTTLATSPNPSNAGESVTFTATISPAPTSGAVQFKVDGSNFGSPASISSGTAQLTTNSLSVATHSVVAVYSGGTGFAGSTSNTVSQVVEASDQTISFTSTPPSDVRVGGPTYTVAADATSGLPVAFSIDSSASSMCSISGAVVSFTGVGSCTINANQAGDDDYNAALQVQQDFFVDKGNQTISFTSTAPSAARVDGSTYTVAASASSGLGVSFAIDSSASSVCSISGAEVSFTRVGTCTINANQAGNDDYNAAPEAQQSFSVAKGNQTISFTSSAPSDARFAGAAYTVSATAASGLPVTFAIDSSSSSICSISGAEVSFTGVGTCTINANQGGDEDYNAAPEAQQSFSVAKGNQSISFTSTAPSDAQVAGATYTVAASATSGLGVSFAIDDSSSSVCSISGAEVSFTATGTCTINADQEGDDFYTAAPQAQQSFSVAQGDQTISFTSTAPSDARVVGPAYTVTAAATSGEAVAFSIDSSASSVCSISGAVVSFTAVGTCTINANQPGNDDYNAAPEAQQSFAVAKGNQTISFTSSAPTGAVVSGPTYTVAASATSGLSVSFSIDDSSSSVCSVSGDAVSLTGAGTCTINADQAGDDDYNAAPQVQQSFDVSLRGSAVTTSCTPDGAAANTAVECSATVSDDEPSGTASTPTGTVQFNLVSGSTGTFSPGNQCTLSDGTCSVSFTPTNSPGELEAEYLGSTTHGGATSATFSENVPMTAVATATTATRIVLSWTPVAGATSYQINRSLTSGAETLLSEVTTTSYLNTGLVPETTYFFTVTAVGPGVTTPEVSDTTHALPPAPTNLRSVSVNASQIKLAWDAAPGADRYLIYSAPTTSGSCDTFARIGISTATTLLVKNLAEATEYCFMVRSLNDDGISADSTVFHETTHAVPVPPTGLRSGTITANKISLAWDAVSGATRYVVERAPFTEGACGTFVRIGTPTGLSFTAGGLSPSTTYCFAVRTTNADGTSAPSAPLTEATHALPPAPSNLAASGVTTSQATLTWDAVGGATRYYLSRAVWNGSACGAFASVGQTTTTRLVTKGLTAGTTYCYVVRVVTPDGTSPNSSVLLVTTAT